MSTDLFVLADILLTKTILLQPTLNNTTQFLSFVVPVTQLFGQF